MKNYLRHNIRRHYSYGRPRISILKDHAQDIKYSSDFVSPLKNIISAYVPDRYKRSGAVIDQTNEKEKKNSGWFDKIFWNNNPVNILKGDLWDKENRPFDDSVHAFKFGSQLKKYVSACSLQFCNIFDKNYVHFKEGNYKSAENISLCDSKNCQVPIKQDQLNKQFDSLEPSVKKSSDHGPLSNSNIARSQSNSHLRKDFLRPFSGISDNVSRSFTTLRPKTGSIKSIVSDPSNATRNLQRSADNRNFLAESEPLPPESTESERDPIIPYEKLKKRDFDWINSFSSEAIILQPSRGEFSIKKLINKTNTQERLWGLPARPSYGKTIGPRMNDNLVQYTVLKHKMQSENKKITSSMNKSSHNFIGEGAETNIQVQKLIKSAKEKNKQFDNNKKKVSAKYSARNVLRTIKDSINLKPIDILKNKEKKVRDNAARHEQKPHKKRSILNFRLPNAKVKGKKIQLLQAEKSSTKPLTEYQSSASYKHVFQELFSKANKTKTSPKPALSVFNRKQTSPKTKKSFHPVNKLSYNLTRNEKGFKKKEPSNLAPERNRTVNLKNQARTPFQKPSNTPLTRKSIASFSTASKISKMIGTTGVSYSKLSKNSRNVASLLELKPSERSISTVRKEEEGNKPVINRTLYTALGYYPPSPKRIEIKLKKKIKKKKNYTTIPVKNEIKSSTQPTRLNNGSFSQQRSITSLGMDLGGTVDTKKSVKPVTEPLNERIFKEVMSLCKEKPVEKKKIPSSEKENSLNRYGRCSVQEKKKPERRRGFVCRIASMLNIGCGRRRRVKQGCPECGKKAG